MSQDGPELTTDEAGVLRPRVALHSIAVELARANELKQSELRLETARTILLERAVRALEGLDRTAYDGHRNAGEQNREGVAGLIQMIESLSQGIAARSRVERRPSDPPAPVEPAEQRSPGMRVTQEQGGCP